MDKITRKNSFEQWFSPINLQLFEENVKAMKLDHYTKKFTTESFLKLLLFAQLHETESLHALSDCLFNDRSSNGHKPRFNQCFTAVTTAQSDESRYFSTALSRFSCSNSDENELFKHHDAFENH
jgi:Domain of unknown function (DUF4372)